MVTGTTRLLGVIGYPVKHSLSPVMHNAALAQLGLDYIYVPFPIAPTNLEAALGGLAAIDVAGFSVTIPHKQKIIPLLSEVSEIAQAVGAVNTVYHTDQGWSGTNTDVEGFVAPLKAYNRDWSETVVVILGYGGAARAVVAGAAQLGCTEIHVVGRDAQKLEAFQHSWESSTFTVRQIHLWEELPQLLSQADLLVNATPIGMSPKVEESPIVADLMTNLPEGAIAYDLIYTPNPTQFLQQAKSHGAIAVDGLEMLIQQGAAALKIWLQLEQVPVDIMRQSLRDYLQL